MIPTPLLLTLIFGCVPVFLAILGLHKAYLETTARTRYYDPPRRYRVAVPSELPWHPYR